MVMTWASRASAARDATHAAIFAPLAPAGRADAIAQRLTDAIQLGMLEQGEKLPSEQELGRTFGVATVTAREALETLRAEQLIETRRGRAGGSFVTATGDDARAALVGRLAEVSRVELRDLGVHYSLIAAGAAERAALFAGPGDTDTLLMLIEDAEKADGAGARRIESGVRLEIAALSRSARLVAEQVRLQSELGPYMWIAMQEREVLRGNAARHRELGAALVAGDSPRARQVVTDQVAWLVDRVLALRETAGR